MRTSKQTLAGIICMLALSLNAQTTDKTQTIKGRIVEQNIETPIGGATVAIINQESSQTAEVVTDADGYYRIENVEVGRLNLQIKADGYASLVIENILLKSGKELVLDFELREEIISMKEVVIKARKDKSSNEMATVSSRGFYKEETEKYAGSWGDPARMATNFAGVFVAGDQRNDIIIRGNSPTGLLWQLEDMPIPSPNHFDVMGTTGGPISMLNNNMLARSDFFTSAFPAEYGNATSGVFDLKLRNGNNEKNEFLAQLGVGGFEFGAEGPISKKHKSSYLVNARYSMLGVMKEFLWIDGLPKYMDISYKLNFPTKHGKVSMFGIAGKSSISFDDDDDMRTTEGKEYKTHTVSSSQTVVVGANYLHIFNSKLKLKTAVSYSNRNPKEVIDSLYNGTPYMQLENNTYRQDDIVLTTKLTKKFNTRNTAAIGGVINNTSFEANKMSSDDVGNTITIDKPYTLSAKGMNLCQLYAEWKHNFTDNLFLSSGLNVLYFDYNKAKSIDPRLGLSWQVSEKNNFGLGYGLHSQLQPINVYFIQTKVGKDENGRQLYEDLQTNKDLDFTKSQQFVASHNYSINKDFRVKTEIYYQYLFSVPVSQRTNEGYFSLINTGAAMSVPEKDYLISNGFGKNYGLEMTFEKFLSNNYYFLVTASIFDSKYTGNDQLWRNTVYNGNYVINTLGGYDYKIKKDMSLNTNIRVAYAGGRRLIPIDLEKSKEQNDTYYMYDQAYEKQAPAYFRLDFKVGLLFQRKKSTHEFAIEVTNITNHKNVYREKYNPETQDIKVSYMQGIYPMGLYRINF